MTTLEVHRYSQNPEQVTACQVTADNLHEIADWCGGTVHEHTRHGHGSVVLPDSPSARRPMAERLATPGWWVLRYPQGEFKILSDMQFTSRYHRTETH